LDSAKAETSCESDESLFAMNAAECFKLFQEYSVLESPGHVNCRHTQHFLKIFPTNENHEGLDPRTGVEPKSTITAAIYWPC
jgi:hypothetical protein